jgi:hypothetical protein
MRAPSRARLRLPRGKASVSSGRAGTLSTIFYSRLEPKKSFHCIISQQRAVMGIEAYSFSTKLKLRLGQKQLQALLLEKLPRYGLDEIYNYFGIPLQYCRCFQSFHIQLFYNNYLPKVAAIMKKTILLIAFTSLSLIFTCIFYFPYGYCQESRCGSVTITTS